MPNVHLYEKCDDKNQNSPTHIPNPSPEMPNKWLNKMKRKICTVGQKSKHIEHYNKSMGFIKIQMGESSTNFIGNELNINSLLPTSFRQAVSMKKLILKSFSSLFNLAYSQEYLAQILLIFQKRKKTF